MTALRGPVVTPEEQAREAARHARNKYLTVLMDGDMDARDKPDWQPTFDSIVARAIRAEVARVLRETSDKCDEYHLISRRRLEVLAAEWEPTP